MTQRFVLGLLALLITAGTAQATALHGIVLDAENDVPLPGATVEIPALGLGTTADAEGEFVLEGVPEGTHTVRVRFVGYQAQEHTVTLPQEHRLEVTLEPDVIAAPDVVVTASPLGRSTTYQPAQALSARELQARAASSFGEMLDGEPGIAMRSFGPGPSRPVIRGFDGDRVLILENGERMGDLSETAHDHNIVLDPLATDRVEIVRGPASLLYGSSAIGGVVNLMTADIPRGWAMGSSGSLALYGGSVNHSLAGLGRYTYGEESWAATGRLSYRDAADLRTPAGTLPGTFIRNLEGAAGLGYETETFTGGLSVMGLAHNFGLPEELDDPDEHAEIVLNRQATQARAEWQTGGFFDSIELRLHGARLFQQEIETELEPDGSTSQDIELEFFQRSANATLTLRHGPLELLEEGALGLNIHGRDMAVGGEEVFTPGVRNASLALFTFQEVPLSNATSLQFGGRVETQRLRALPNEAFAREDRQRRSTAFSGSVGLNVRPVEPLEVGMQLARSHRFPILEELYADGVHFGAGVYEEGHPELGDEVGLGSDLFVRWTGSRLSLEVAGFYNRLHNYIAFQPSGTTFVDERERTWDVYRYEAHHAELFGGEATLGLILSDALELGAVVDYVRGTRLDGTPLPTMPPLRIRLTLRYDVEAWWMGTSLRLVDQQTRVAPDEDPTGGYALLGLEGGYRLDGAGNHALILRLDNATNTLYRDHLSRVDRTEFGSPMPGRNLNLMYRWMF